MLSNHQNVHETSCREHTYEFELSSFISWLSKASHSKVKVFRRIRPALAKSSNPTTKPSNSLARCSIPSLSMYGSDSAILSWHCQAGHARLWRSTWQKCNAGFPARTFDRTKGKSQFLGQTSIAFSASSFRRCFLARTTRFYQLLLTSTGDRGLDAAAYLLDSVYSIADKWRGDRGSLRGGEFWSVWWWITTWSIYID